MIYEAGNAAKQWILSELDRIFGQTEIRVLDLGCGDAKKWQRYLADHSGTRVVGIDTDAQAIARGQNIFAGNQNIELRVLDAQKPLEQAFDVVVAMSAVEHVVDRPAFLRTVWDTLKNGGAAYLNYDAGHFRTRDWKERLMVPLSQVLAVFGIEGPYMKRVDDDFFRRQAQNQGFSVLQVRKNNLGSLKGLMRGADEEGVRVWYEFEDRLNALFTPQQLDEAMYSTTLVVKKP